MNSYSKTELEEAIKSMTSTLNKCEKSFEKLAEGTSQHTLMKRRIKAFLISLELMKKEFDNCTE
jgi:hypothetical protein